MTGDPRRKPFPLAPSQDVAVATTSFDTSELERLTRAYGQELFARVDRRGPLLFSPGWFDERLMAWTMSDPAVEVQPSRSIDAVPLLTAPESVARHLREYFEEARD